jgi:hypothetical protein
MNNRRTENVVTLMKSYKHLLFIYMSIIKCHRWKKNSPQNPTKKELRNRRQISSLRYYKKKIIFDLSKNRFNVL